MRTANKPYSDLPAMALGFYHEDRNGLNIVGHGGDTVFFHSDLHLFLDKNVGLYISMNSIGKDGAAHALREELLQQFADRYFPAPQQNLPTVEHRQGARAGDVGPLCQQPRGRVQLPPPCSRCSAKPRSASTRTAYLVASSITDLSGTPRKWREVKPWLWQEVNGADYLQAILDGNGGIKMFSITPYAPIIEFLPAPASLNAGWILPVGRRSPC